MSYQATVCNVMIASPGDVQIERNLVREARKVSREARKVSGTVLRGWPRSIVNRDRAATRGLWEAGGHLLRLRRPG